MSTVPSFFLQKDEDDYSGITLMCIMREGPGPDIPEINERQRLKLPSVTLLWFFLAFFPLGSLIFKASAPGNRRLY